MFPKQMPSFICTKRDSVPPPPLPQRKSSRTSDTRLNTTSEQRNRLTSSLLNRHKQCFNSPNEKVSTVLRKAPLCRSRSAGTVTTLAAARSKAESSADSKHTRVSRQHAARLDSANTGRELHAAALHRVSRSPVAFGRSISKERTFAEEKKRLEETLPGRMNFEASTNILRDPSLKSPEELKHAIRSYAMHRSQSVPRALSALSYPNLTVYHQASSRHSMCFPRHPDSVIINTLCKDSKKWFTTGLSKSPTKKSYSIKLAGNLLENRASAIPNASPTISLTRTNSTFSIDSTPSPFLSSKIKMKKIKANNKPVKPGRKESTKSPTKILRSADTNASRCVKKFSTHSSPEVVADKSAHSHNQLACNQIHPPRYFRVSYPIAEGFDREFASPSTVHEKTKFWDTISKDAGKSDDLGYLKYTEVNEYRSLSPRCSRRYVVPRPKVEDKLYGELNKKSHKLGTARKAHTTHSSRTGTPSYSIKDISLTREVRIPQTSVLSSRMSPSRRRIDCFRPSSKADRIIRASSLSSADDHSKRGLYLCGELAHSATSLNCAEKHSPRCPYRNNSKRFEELSRFYSNLERVGQLERATSTSNIKAIRKNRQPLDFDEWHKVRLHERAEKELNYLLEKLTQDQLEKDLLFRTKDPEVVKWSGEKDYGLRSMNKSVENLRENYEIRNFGKPKMRDLDSSENMSTLYKRCNTVADLPLSMERGTQNADTSHDRGLSSSLVSTLSKDQMRNIANKLNEIYCPKAEADILATDISDTFTTVKHDSIDSDMNWKNLKVRCNSSITKDELIGPTLARKNAFETLSSTLKQNQKDDRIHSLSNATESKTQERSPRSLRTRTNSPVLLARETRGAIAAENAKVVFLQPPEIPEPKRHLEKHSCQTEKRSPKGTTLQEAITTETVPCYPQNAIDKISHKIQYFEKRRYDQPPKTVYHAREESSPEEDDELIHILDEHKKKPNQATYHHKEMSSSLTDLREQFGEKQSARLNFSSHPLSRTTTTTSGLVTEIEREIIVNCSTNYKTSSAGKSADNVKSYYRSRSASPKFQTSCYLSRVRTGEVQKIKDKFESLGRPTRNQHFVGLRVLRKVRSDPEINSFRSELKDVFNNSSNGDETGHVSWIAHRFELYNLYFTGKYGRSRFRKLTLPPISNKNQQTTNRAALMAHDSYKSCKRSTPSPTRSAAEHTRCIYERSTLLDLASSGDTKLTCSAPDEQEPKTTLPQVKASLMAHKYPRKVHSAFFDNLRHKAKSENSSKELQVKRCIKRTEKQRSGSFSPPRSIEVIGRHQHSEPNSNTKHCFDFFANQDFDAKKHQPKARYVPDASDTNFWKRATVHPSCSGNCGSLKKSAAIKFQGFNTA